jgi:hypothetical protein
MFVVRFLTPSVSARAWNPSMNSRVIVDSSTSHAVLHDRQALRVEVHRALAVGDRPLRGEVGSASGEQSNRPGVGTSEPLRAYSVRSRSSLLGFIPVHGRSAICG